MYRIASGAVGVFLGGLTLWKLKQSDRVSKKLSIIMVVQLLVVIISLGIVYSTSKSLQNREGLPVVNQIASWIIIGKLTPLAISCFLT